MNRTTNDFGSRFFAGMKILDTERSSIEVFKPEAVHYRLRTSRHSRFIWTQSFVLTIYSFPRWCTRGDASTLEGCLSFFLPPAFAKLHPT